MAARSLPTARPLVTAPDRPYRLLRAGAVAAAVAVPVTVAGLLVRSESSAVHRADVRTVRAATAVSAEHPELHRAALVWEEVTQPRWVNLAAVLVAVVLWRRPALRGRVVWAAATLLAIWAANHGVKAAIRRSRPVLEEALTHAPGYSYPSGHAMTTTGAAVVLGVLVWPLLGPRGRAAVVALGTAVVAVTGADRVALGAHYPSDVVAGSALGAALATASWLSYRGRHSPEPTRV